MVTGTLNGTKSLNMAALDELCRLCGIQSAYTDIWGKCHTVSSKTKQALLAAMGIVAGDEDLLTAALVYHQDRSWRRCLPKIKVMRVNSFPLNVPLTLTQQQSAQRYRWTLSQEQGDESNGEFLPAELQQLEERELNGIVYRRYVFSLPDTLSPGYHQLRIAGVEGVSSTGAEMTVIVTPETCYQPDALAEDARVWGPGVQLYALRSQRNWGMGDFTDLKTLVEYSAEHGASIVGVSPLHTLYSHNPVHCSPYSPSTRLFLNTLYIDIEAIPEFAECQAAKQAVTAAEFQARLASMRNAELVDYVGVAAAKLPVLERLYQYFQEQHMANGSYRARAFREFQDRWGETLDRQALYETLQEFLHRQDRTVWGWPVWPERYRDPASAAVKQFAVEHEERIEFFQYLQWLADEQLGAVARRSLELKLGVGLYQDLAVGVDRAGAETWSQQQVYALNAKIGAPPDDFNQAGQDWGLPPMIPFRLQDQAYGPFIATLRANMHHAGALRVDHILGLLRLFWIPRDATPAEGAYVHYPIDDLLGILALESQRNHCLIIGEDLGTVPDELRARLAPMGILSYRLFYFEKDSQGDFKPPGEYEPNALVSITTHDLPTLAGFWQGQDIAERTELGLFPVDAMRNQQILERSQDRARLLLALRREGLLPEGMSEDPATCPEMTSVLARAVHVYVARTPAKVLLLQLEDVLGQRLQVNLPATTDQRPNWRYKLDLDLEDFRYDARLRMFFSAMIDERGTVRRPSKQYQNAPKQAANIPCATYRLQFNRDFTFAQAAALVPYLAKLGISHCYASPYLKARAGSGHGYDIVDHNALNPEIGKTEDYEAFVTILHEHGMGQILDIVPNHMGVGGDDNIWWLDVLENGQASMYAGFFDIDWRPLKDELRGKVLLPVLGDHYGKVLERGELKLMLDVGKGAFGVRYFGHYFPIDPQSYPRLLARGVERLEALLGAGDVRLQELQSLTTAFSNLPGHNENSPDKAAERTRDKEIHKKRLATLCRNCHEIRELIGENVSYWNGVPGDVVSYDELHGLLEQQAYRLAYWQVAADEINYRRFFDINDLAGLRMEKESVFNATHRFIIDLIVTGKVDGLRIDHPDGLYDPAQYYRRLREAVELARQAKNTRGVKTRAGENPAGGRLPLFVVVEKILANYEHLPEDWSVQGTTGYDFSNLVNGLLVYAPAEKAMDRIYERFIGVRIDFDQLLYDRKKLIMTAALSSELTVLANQLNRISEANRDTRDFTLTALRRALTEVVACFPVYRTYVSGDRVTTEDRRYVDWANALAKKRNPAIDVSIFDFIRRLLLLEDLESSHSAERQAIIEFTMRFQQYTAPVMAKGLEDTSFYSYNRLISLNEVGGDPRRFGVSIAAFHHANEERARRWPHSMLNTSTHDSKRSVDVRVRINVLTELTEEWKTHLARWSRINRSKKSKVDEKLVPDRNDEYLLYQTLIGVWPVEDIGTTDLEGLCTRIERYMLKAIKEAKVHTSWINPNSDYERAVTDFTRALLSSPDTNMFLADFLPFVKRIERFGMLNSLSQTLLKLTAPGVPDIYQGSEIWNFNLVDPDNRQPVDYRLRQSLLARLESLETAQTNELAQWVYGLMDTLENGQAKFYLIWKVLQLRCKNISIFNEGSYIPLQVEGPFADHICAFARIQQNKVVLVVAPRWFVRLTTSSREKSWDATVWNQTWLVMPFELSELHFSNVLTGEDFISTTKNGQSLLPVSALLAHFPVALVTAEIP